MPTPEGVDLAIRTAGPLPRGLAWCIDVIIRWIFIIILAQMLAVLEEAGIGVLLILVFVIEFLYPVLFEVLSKGSTPGKKLLGIMVVHDDGTPVGWKASMTRNLLRLVDWLPSMYLFGLISCLFSQEFKRIGDLAAGTVVVYRDLKTRLPVMEDTQPEAPPWSLAPHEQRAIIDFAVRQGQLTPERATELAQQTGPLVGQHREDARQQLLRYAQYLLGRQP
ncbi:RDD family protein [Leeia sp. IMCC25680]|uniref:RDD family protein n=1 Tax=Leeia aquatica TaxID=2725557 RepID=A0A847S041_9NEIS|nr:RDD family protein [Leeia aquatica]